MADGGLEYILGVATADEGGNLAYECRWALDRGRERAVFEWFIGFTFERLQRFPDLHIYHFGAYRHTRARSQQPPSSQRRRVPDLWPAP